MRALQTLQEFSGVGGAREYQCLYHSLPSQSGWVLWPACKVTAACSQTHCPSPLWPSTKGIRRSTALVHAPGLPTWSHVAQKFSAPDSLGTHLALNGLSNPPGTHKLQRDCFYIRPHFQDWERELFYPIHINKQEGDCIKTAEKS